MDKQVKHKQHAMDAVPVAEERSVGPFSPLQPFDIGHAPMSPWSSRTPPSGDWFAKDELADALGGSDLLDSYREKAEAFAAKWRCCAFSLKPSAVYFNPTERCNLNCCYCYIPEECAAAAST